MKSWIYRLKRLLGLSKNTSGFTLIELLVVIGILGILAAALVATINPFEQLNKAQDANVQNTLVEYINANVRYYTTHNAMPWDDTANTAATSCVAAATGGTLVSANLSSLTGCLDALVNDAELKSSFTTVTNILSQIKVTGGATDVTACYAPLSNSERNNPNTKFNATGGSAAGCPGTAGCYWCSE